MEKLFDRAFVATITAWVMHAAVMIPAAYTGPGITAEEARITNVVQPVVGVITVAFFGIALVSLRRSMRRIKARREASRAGGEATR